jgi:hypothetical protein
MPSHLVVCFMKCSRDYPHNSDFSGLEIAACVAFTFIPPLLLKVNHCCYSQKNSLPSRFFFRLRSEFEVTILTDTGTYLTGAENQIRRIPYAVTTSTYLFVQRYDIPRL